MGFGCVLRNSLGEFLSARASNASLKVQSHEAEVVTTRPNHVDIIRFESKMSKRVF